MAMALGLECAAGGGVADDTHLMAGSGLCKGEIRDVAEDPPDRRSDDMNDAQGRGSHEKLPVSSSCTPELWLRVMHARR